jgi:hypothetical protein
MVELLVTVTSVIVHLWPIFALPLFCHCEERIFFMEQIKEHLKNHLCFWKGMYISQMCSICIVFIDSMVPSSIWDLNSLLDSNFLHICMHFV